MYTKDNITELGDNQIFVFGSNTAGLHGGGAALVAKNKFKAEQGIGEGTTGSTYAYPTLNGDYSKRTEEELITSARLFYNTVRDNPNLTFILTKVGCGIAGFTEDYMKRFFRKSAPNLIKPKGWDEMLGYKVFNPEMTCRDFIYEVSKTYTHEGEVRLCNSGFHFCENVSDCFNYYSFDTNNRIAKVRGFGECDYDFGDKVSFSNIEIIEEISWEEMLTLANSGYRNSGNRNSGDYNSGDYNSGYRNSGNRNSGDYNSGSYNSGNRNSGSYNSGYRNSGDYNSGYRNSGNRNSGDYNSGSYNSGNRNSGSYNRGSYNSGYRNSGDYNSGNRNSGDYNSGDYNSGLFNTDTTKLKMFNKETDKVRSDIYLPSWLSFDLTQWKYSEDMSDKEKELHPNHSVLGGWLFILKYKEAAQLSYNKATEEEKRSIEDLPNYDADILFEIFGIDRRK